MKKNLVLNLKKEYFDQIKSGEKEFEYRLVGDYWDKRLIEIVGHWQLSRYKSFENIIIRLGYPKKGDTEKEIVRPWCGAEVHEIRHKLFGPDPVNVHAIRVN